MAMADSRTATPAHLDGLVGSVGPVCSAALRKYGIEPDLEAAPPKMGVLVHLLSRHAHGLLEQKRARN